MAKKELTPRQRSILEFIQDRIARLGQPPTIREIGKQFGISSTNGVRSHLSALVKKGHLKKHALISRGLELARKVGVEVGRVPLVGSVPAGVPLDAIENIEGEIAIDTSYLPDSSNFTLRVQGDSMKNAGIFDGDLILVRKQETAEDGEIVVALVNGEATVKRYFRQGNGVRLQPENDAFEPILVSPDDGEFGIAGKVVGLLRRMN